ATRRVGNRAEHRKHGLSVEGASRYESSESNTEVSHLRIPLGTTARCAASAAASRIVDDRARIDVLIVVVISSQISWGGARGDSGQSAPEKLSAPRAQGAQVNCRGQAVVLPLEAVQDHRGARQRPAGRVVENQGRRVKHAAVIATADRGDRDCFGRRYRRQRRNSGQSKGGEA